MDAQERQVQDERYTAGAWMRRSGMLELPRGYEKYIAIHEHTGTACPEAAPLV